jgi:hypothetical protein
MFDKKESNEDLKAFEARLAALRPRADRLDPAWRSLLEKEAILAAGARASRPLVETKASRPLGEDTGDRGETPLCFPAGGTPPFHQAGGTPALRVGKCTNPAGHRFLCVHCGSEARAAARRWPWPAALAAMTCAAAVLLVMLATQQAPPGSPAGSPGNAVSPLNLADGAVAGQHGADVGENTASYLCLRGQILSHGVEWLDRPLPTPYVPTTSTDKPLTSREFLDRLIEEQGLRSS